MTIDNATLSNQLVVDASVAVKWFSFEPDTPEARVFFQKIETEKIVAFAPELILYEVGNSLWKSKKMEQVKIAASLQYLLDSNIQFRFLDPTLVHNAINLMTTYDLSFYDAVYAALAQILSIPLLTANPKDHKKIKEIEVVEL